MLSKIYIDSIIKRALLEDMNYGDITTDTLISPSQISKGNFIAKEDGVIAGIEVAKRVFKFFDDTIEFEIYKKDGSFVKKGEIIACIEGKTASILKCERTALNLLQRLSGIATMTRNLVKEVEDTKVRIVDTRKTIPGLRVLEKYAVTMGGGYNHRFNLSDGVLIKDNHIFAVGGIKEAINKIRNKIPHTMKIEIEVENLEQLKEALDAKADIIMLDNMSLDMMREAVKINNGRALLEASGNITVENVRDIAKTGVDIISCGALTHSVKALDISLKFI
ncbi:carboxylating nicotinate-nucleotide diphosphorylase [Defluviitalea phaphyphila]|uniref:carboxylating nicotinate-nucleotide diphosphorylase n=1 Tax=Defluviitalea phaphyphila TaxID=1473580 RepID=UPI000731B01E|nr:carboxylating nicotinate-nucleotide diphosphorylase [Defluviitalea phaphyphila]